MNATTTPVDRAADLVPDFRQTKADACPVEEGRYGTMVARASIEGRVGNLRVDRRGYLHRTDDGVEQGYSKVEVASYEPIFGTRRVEAREANGTLWVTASHRLDNDEEGDITSNVTIFLSEHEARELRDQLNALDLD
jgi:hypothetical protein